MPWCKCVYVYVYKRGEKPPANVRKPIDFHSKQHNTYISLINWNKTKSKCFSHVDFWTNETSQYIGSQKPSIEYWIQMHAVAAINSPIIITKALRKLITFEKTRTKTI